jgi:chorismate--pyruvate lyase
MRERSLRRANWYRHVLAVNAPVPLARWLTSRLKAHAGAFRVQVLHQSPARCLADEAAVLGQHGARQPRGQRRGRVWEREVLLRCDNAPVVFAHTVVPMSADASDWPLFSALGDRSLGTTLFGDPLVVRGPLEYARLRGSHPLARRARAALAAQGIAIPAEQLLYARRCLYRRRQGTLLVTEVFLPRVAALVPKTSNTR